MGLRRLQDLLGHSCPKTTALYTHLTGVVEHDNAQAINQLIQDLFKAGRS
jgi:site-specific recombinase XerD